MMMRLVERLAKNWFDDGPCRTNCEVSASEEARWWLNAIADELDNELHNQAYHGVSPEDIPLNICEDIVSWLRTQASTGASDE